VLDAWHGWSPAASPTLGWSAAECRARWDGGIPLILQAPPRFEREALEPLLGPVLEELAGIGEEEAEAMRRFAVAWDEERIAVSALLPGLPKEGAGTLHEAFGVSTDLLSFVTYLGLRPPLETYFAAARAHLSADLWDASICPLCAAPPCFGDIGEDGKRWLSCALCGARWTIGRLRCAYCDNRDAKALTRLAAEGEEEGYLIEACDVCRGYLKGVDRRLRWNAASALIEDWGTPHLDLIAYQRGYWRATPSLVQLAAPSS
jgi:hypothetical protein